MLLREGKPARLAQMTAEELPAFRALQLLTSKPVLYVCNVDEASAADGNAFSKKVEERAKSRRRGHRRHLSEDRKRVCRARA